MSYSDDTAVFMFSGQDVSEFKEHAHDYFFRTVTGEGWVFTCDCGRSILKSNEWMEAEGQKGSGGNSPTTSV